MAYGLSTLFICQTHENKGSGSRTAIDPHQRTRFGSVGLSNVREAGLGSYLNFRETPSSEALPELCRATHVVRRFVQTPLTPDVGVKHIGENVCVLRKPGAG